MKLISGVLGIICLFSQPAFAIRCSDEYEEVSIGAHTQTTAFIASSSTIRGKDLASQIARSLGLGWSADHMILRVPLHKGCQMINTSRTIGIESISCAIIPGGTLTLGLADHTNKIIHLNGGNVVYHRNLYYGGTASLSMTITTENGQTALASRSFQVEACTDGPSNGTLKFEMF